MILRHLRMCCAVLVVLLNTTLMAQGAARQEILDMEVTISLKDVTLKQALQEIETIAKVKFVYSRSYLKLDEKVSIEVTSKKLGQLLDELFTPREIKFSVHDTENFVVLTQARLRGELLMDPIGKTDGESKFALRVSGKVVDQAGNSMAGVNIVEKGTTNGTGTDAEGKYSIDVDEQSTLIFSFIGYKPVEINVSNRSVIDITMEEDQAVLDQVLVNAGYWKVSEREQTGSIARVTSDDIQQQPVNNPLAAMVGRMPGVNIQQQSGMAGSGFTIQIRGQNSLRDNGNDPLYIIDGVPFPTAALDGSYSPLYHPSPLNTINPSDIESIEVLKDADATAIYGTRGANGVVLIATKKGGAGKTKMDVNVYTGVGKVGRFMKLLNTQQYLEMRHEAHKNDGFPVDPFWEADLAQWDSTRYTDWQKVLLGGTAKITNAQIGFSGGNANTQFQVGSTFYSEGSVFPGDFGDKRFSTHVSLSHQSPNKKFNLGFQNTLSLDNNKLPLVDLTSTALMLPPNAPRLFNDDGTLNWENSTWPNFTNPAIYQIVDYGIKSQNLVSNFNISYEILTGLRIKSSVGYNTLASKDLSLGPIAASDPAFGVTTGYSDNTSGLTQTWIVEPQAEYEKKLGQGTLLLLLGSTFQETIRNKESIRAYGNNDALLENIGSASSVVALESNSSEYKYSAAFGRANYSLKGKYIFNATARRDGSSRFGPAKRFANFGAVGAAWIFSEDLLKGSNVVSFGKVRTSFGLTGSDQIADYGFMDSYTSVRYPYNGQSGLVPARLANADYSWERTTKMEVAIDLGFFNDLLGLSGAYYRNRSSNQLVGYSLPQMTGFSSVQYNLPATVQNTGLEVELRSTNIRTSSLRWTTSVNLTVPRNKLVSYPGIESSPNANLWIVGKGLNETKLYHYTGVDPATGLYTFQDFDNNGSWMDNTDKKASKKLGQNYYGSITNSIQFKGFDLTFMLQFVNQTSRNFMASLTTFGTPGGSTNQPVEVMDRWQKTGDVTNIQKFTMDTPGYLSYLYAGFSDNLIVNASFIKIKNVSVSYTIPQFVAEALKLTSVRIYAQGQNLFTFTKFKGLDPEFPLPTNLPPLRVITAGLQVSI